ncbi:MAG: ribose-5-phosphate isomerase RpiA [Methanobacteriaceae archaeon]|nr:ribose-5-phosphate isomerase RpiA [Methanobacteriaceae archaeon]
MNLKKDVAEYAVKFVNDGQVIGLGTGSTSSYFIKKLGKRIKDEELDIIGVATSYQAFQLAIDCGIKIGSTEEYDIDLAIDGADAIDYNLDIIKGGGASHTIEKIVDYAANKFYVIADEEKYVDELSEIPLPIEIIPVAVRLVSENLKDMGAKPVLRIAKNKQGPVVSDNGNFIIDAKFQSISNPPQLERSLNSIPGVVENGLFTQMADKVILGTKNGVKEI